MNWLGGGSSRGGGGEDGLAEDGLCMARTTGLGEGSEDGLWTAGWVVEASKDGRGRSRHQVWLGRSVFVEGWVGRWARGWLVMGVRGGAGFGESPP